MHTAKHPGNLPYRVTLMAFILLTAAVLNFLVPGKADASLASHVVISEVYPYTSINESVTHDEFLELYNPTGAAIDIGGYSYGYITSTGGYTQEGVIPEGTFVQPRSFYLIGEAATLPDGNGGTVAADLVDSLTIPNADGGYWIKDSQGNVVDKVAWGGSAFGEGRATSNPGLGRSLERKANDGSDPTGAGEDNGNGWDTDDNSADLVIRDVPGPQNGSQVEPPDPAGSSQATISLAGPETAVVGGQFNLEVQASNYSGFYGFQVQLNFDRSKLQVVDADPEVEGLQIRPGSIFSGYTAQEVAHAVYNDAGTIIYAVTLAGAEEGVSGMEPVGLAEITFEVTGSAGDTAQVVLDQDNIKLSGYPGSQGWQITPSRGVTSMNIAIIPGDTLPPEISQTFPADQASGIPITLSGVTVTFNETVVALDLEQIRLERLGEGGVWEEVTPALLGTAALAQGGTTLSIPIKAEADLDYGRTYRITIPAGTVQDLAGNLNSGYSWSFTTEGGVGDISGYVKAQGRTDQSLIAVKAIDAGGKEYSGSIRGDGFFLIENLPAGTYAVVASLPGYFAVSRAGVVVNTGQTTDIFNLSALANGGSPAGEMRAGNVYEGDNEVNIYDAAIIGASWLKSRGEAGFDARADLNDDGRVDSADLSLVRQNFLYKR